MAVLIVVIHIFIRVLDFVRIVYPINVLREYAQVLSIILRATDSSLDPPFQLSKSLSTSVI